jgi:hypothetical protein
VPNAATHDGSFPKYCKPNKKYTAKIISYENKGIYRELKVLHPHKFPTCGVIKASIKIFIRLLTVHFSASFAKPFRNPFQKTENCPCYNCPTVNIYLNLWYISRHTILRPKIEFL